MKYKNFWNWKFWMLNLMQQIPRGSLYMYWIWFVSYLFTNVFVSTPRDLHTLTGFAIGHKAITRWTSTLVTSQGVSAFVLTGISGFTFIDICGKKHEHVHIRIIWPWYSTEVFFVLFIYKHMDRVGGSCLDLVCWWGWMCKTSKSFHTLPLCLFNN